MTQAWDLVSLSDAEVVNRLDAVARPICRRRNVSPAFVVGKAISEMGYADVPWMVASNNLFGMNACKELTFSDTEWAKYKTTVRQSVPQGSTQAAWVYGVEDMKKYRSMEDSIDDFCAMLVERHHCQGKSAEQVLQYGLPGYTTDKSWTTHVRVIIKKWGLVDMKATDITVDKFIEQVEAFAKTAHDGHYSYGDSHSAVPSADHVTSCDRGAVARPLYNLGFTDQRTGGETVITLPTYLPAHGFETIRDANKLKRGDIVIFRKAGESKPSAAWHVFVLKAFRNTGSIDKYDFGSQDRINRGCFFAGARLDEWENKDFYAAYRIPEKKETGYTIEWESFGPGYNGPEAYLGTNLLKGRGWKGVYGKDGKRKDLELNFQWTMGDVASLYSYCEDRAAHGKILDCSGGVFREEIFLDLTGGIKTIKFFDASAEGHVFDPSVFVVQTLLKGRGLYKGKLDGVTGAQTAAAVKAFRAAVGLPESTQVDHDLCGNLCAGV